MANRKWWQDAVFYQIYPRSFADGNGDGIGDFQGIIERLDYLKDLGIDALWLSPHFPSPGFDAGYDVADYENVAPEYGTLDDFRRFLDGAHERGLRVLLDLVLNHTSDQHPWFVESRSSRENPRRDWYVWRDPVDDGPPNNWMSTFGGPAWELDPVTGQYYYHFFLKQQPDLNWRNSEVKQAMWGAVRFWLDMGVDGFRLDAIDTIYEDPALPNHTTALTQDELYRQWRLSAREKGLAAYIEEREDFYEHQLRRPGLHELLQELRSVVDEYDDRVLVGESDDLTYCGDGTNELHLVFNFPLMRTVQLTPAWVRANQRLRLAALPSVGWPCNTLGNHDSPRMKTHYGDGVNDDALARLHMVMLLSLRGTPFLFNGEEIGMTDYRISDIARFRDPVGIHFYRLELDVMGSTPAAALAFAAGATRDCCRTPVQWMNKPNGGFSPEGVDTWLPVNPNYAGGINVEEQLADPGSLLNFYRCLLRTRKEVPALLDGDYTVVHPTSADYLAYLRRREGGQNVLVALNMGDRPQTINFTGLGEFVPVSDGGRAHLVFSTHARGSADEDLRSLVLAPYEGYIGEVR